MCDVSEVSVFMQKERVPVLVDQLKKAISYHLPNNTK
jgi:hypothetical protein